VSFYSLLGYSESPSGYFALLPVVVAALATTIASLPGYVELLPASFYSLLGYSESSSGYFALLPVVVTALANTVARLSVVATALANVAARLHRQVSIVLIVFSHFPGAGTNVNDQSFTMWPFIGPDLPLPAE
jgi:hypothetical protein